MPSNSIILCCLLIYLFITFLPAGLKFPKFFKILELSICLDDHAPYIIKISQSCPNVILK